jgi:DNA invertase Pin-like site-specific DNA recombinase
MNALLIARGSGLSRQIESLLEYCHREHHDIVGVVADHRTVDLSRVDPAIVEGVIMTDPSRLTRSPDEFESIVATLSAAGIRVMTMNDTPDASTRRFLSQARALFEEYEHELRSARIRRGIALARQRRQQGGGPGR